MRKNTARLRARAGTATNRQKLRAGFLLLVLFALQATPAICNSADSEMSCCNGKVCSAMRHAESKSKKSACRSRAREHRQAAVLDCSMDCCRSITYSVILSATFILPKAPDLAFQLVSARHREGYGAEFRDFLQYPEIPPPRSLS